MIIWIEPFISGEERKPSYRDVVMIDECVYTLRKFIAVFLHISNKLVRVLDYLSHI